MAMAMREADLSFLIQILQSSFIHSFIKHSLNACCVSPSWGHGIHLLVKVSTLRSPHSVCVE